MIERRLVNLLELDYPPQRVEIVVASDASTDRTNEIVQRVADREPRVRLIDCERGGKVAAQDRAVRETTGDVVAFSDANASWARDALRLLVANLADPEVGYVCGQLRLEAADGSNQEGAVLALRAEAARGRVDARVGHGRQRLDLRAQPRRLHRGRPEVGSRPLAPYRMVQAGRRAVYEPGAHAFERPTPSNETEYRRKVRMFEHCWEITLRGAMFRRVPPLYLVELVSHRLLRYGSGILHVILLATSVALVTDGWGYGIVLAAQLALIGAAAAGLPIARTTSRHVGHPRGALELRATRCAGDVGGGGGDAVNRALDITAAVLGLTVASPLLAAGAIAIKLEDGGPVLFHQVRVGKDGDRLRVAEIAHDDRRCRAEGRRLRRRAGR